MRADFEPVAPSPHVGTRRYGLALLVIAVAVAVSFAFSWFSGPRGVTAPFLVALMLIGIWFGRLPALVAVIPAFISYNFFTATPHFNLALAPGDVLALASFLLTALVVGGLAGSLSDRARGTADQLRLVTALLDASRDMSAASTKAEVAQRLAEHIKNLGGEAVVWVPENGQLKPEASTRLAAEAGALDHGPQDQAPLKGAAPAVRVLETARGELATAVVWQSDRAAEHSEQWMAALLQLGAIAFDRARLSEEISEARMVAEREGLRTALLSSLSHDLRTPIATIVASASSLSEYGATFEPQARNELIAAILGQGERLNRYVSNLLEMTRLESGALSIRRVLVDPAEPASSALEHMRRRLQDRRIVRSYKTRGVAISVDPVLLEQAIVNLLENALSYSPTGSTIHVETWLDASNVCLAVSDQGPGVSDAELPYIFDKFFRGGADRNGRDGGVGLGLSVARGVVEAFDGHIAAERPGAGGSGVRFTIRLPAHRMMEVAG